MVILRSKFFFTSFQLKFLTVYPAPSARLEWSCALRQPVADSRSSCFAGSVGDIPSMFTHHLRSGSVCLSLWPQHKQLHPQINKTRGRGHKCSRTFKCSVQEAPRQRVCLYARLCLRVCVCVHNTGVCNWKRVSVYGGWWLHSKLIVVFCITRSYFFFFEIDAPKLFSHSSLFSQHDYPEAAFTSKSLF